MTICISEVPSVTPEAVAALTIGDFSNNSNSTQCFVKCFFEKAQFMDNTGKLNLEKMRESLATDTSKEEIDAIFKKCSGIQGANSCETAFKIYECYKKK